MKLEISIKELTGNIEVLNRARTTVWKEHFEDGKEPSSKFLNSIFMSEHSPIRVKLFLVSIKNIESWVATHFVRHHVGSTPFVSTQRDDRHFANVKVSKRSDARQGELVNIDMVLNAQAFIDISKVRLCGMASVETQRVWYKVINELKLLLPELADKCVPSCVYRGFCPEDKSCGRDVHITYKEWRQRYVGNRVLL